MVLTCHAIKPRLIRAINYINRLPWKIRASGSHHWHTDHLCLDSWTTYQIEATISHPDTCGKIFLQLQAILLTGDQPLVELSAGGGEMEGSAERWKDIEGDGRRSGEAVIRFL